MQTWDANQYAETARFVSDLGRGVVDLLAPKPGERVLDLGCGDGALAEQLVAAGCVVVAVDAAPDMVRAAKTRGLDAFVMDGQSLTFVDQFDAVFSNAALHWMRDMDAVLRGVHRALRTGGRFVAEFGGGHNVRGVVNAFSVALGARGIEADSVNPWYFPAPGEFAERLRAHGFEVSAMDLFERPTPIPGDIVAWLRTFGQCFINAVPPEERWDLLAEVRETLADTHLDAAGHWQVDYVRLRFAAARS